MRIPGIQCENTRRVVHLALDAGWRFDGKTRSNHGVLTWPPTGAQLFFGFTPSDRNAWKTFARDIEVASGVVVWQRVKHGASHRRTAAPESRRVLRDRARFERAAAEKAAAHRQALAERERRARSAQIAADNEERRRFYSALMQPGNGH